MSQPDRPKQSFADYVAIAISPALLIGLIASLVFFLLEVLYAGVYQSRLQWILFFYVFGIVLASRVAMTEGIANRSGLYGLLLSALTWVGLLIYVKFPPDNPAAPLAPFINGGLIVLAWWCAYKLTRDCTNIDEEMEVPGEGLLQASGLETVRPDPREAEPSDPGPGEKPAKREDGLAAWWERMQRHLAGKGKKRTPGVWVVYFSLAALPLFGLGQSLIPPAEEGRRRYTFWLLTVYVASGLGLLLTTCFLGLRRYLRQRRLTMPAAMTGTWLTVGGAMAAVLLVAGALLPRPQSEYQLIDLGRSSSEDRSASRYAVKGDSPGKGDGRTGSDPKGGKDGKDGNGQGEKGNGEGAKGKAEGGKGKEQGDGGGGKQQGDKGSSGGGQKGKEPGDGDKSGGEKSSDQPKSRDASRTKQGEQKSQEAKDGEKKDGDSRSESRPESSAAPPSTSGIAAALAKFLKWVVFVVLALLVVFYFFRSGLQFLANFTEWARNLLEWLNNFWAGLFGGWGARGGGDEGATEDSGPLRAPPKPFSAFANPFATGNAERWSAKALLRYSFEALEAWARERDLGRHPGETPLEFAGRVGGEVPALEADARRLASLHARGLYAAGELPAATTDAVRQFWERLETVAEQPLSA